MYLWTSLAGSSRNIHCVVLIAGQLPALRRSAGSAECRYMKHIEPPENLPLVPTPSVPSEPETTEIVPEEDVHFRDRGEGRTLRTTPAEAAVTRGTSAPAPRSLQPINSDMTRRKERPIRAPDDLLSVDDVAERLLLSRAAVYRLVARRDLPCYRLPGGFRFKADDVDAFLESRRSEADSHPRHGRPQDQW